MKAAALLTHVADRMVAAAPAFRTCVVRDPMILPAKPYYLAFAKPFYERHAELCSAIWDAIAAIRGSTGWLAYPAQSVMAMRKPR